MINIDRDNDFRPAIKKIMDELGLIKSNMELLIKSFDKVMKEKKQLSHSQQLPTGDTNHDHTKSITLKKVK